MAIFPRFLLLPTSLFSKTLALLVFVAVMTLLAESCVKRPNWEPTPGVSPKGIEFVPVS